MSWLFIVLTILLAFSHEATSNPLSRHRRAWEDDCPPGVWGCKRALAVTEEKRNEDDCPPGVWGCKRNTIEERDEDCPPGVWGCKREIEMKSNNDDDCPPGVWGCKRGLFGSVKSWFKSKGKSKRSVKEADEECPPGVWGCKREDKKEELGEEGCPPGVWGCKKDVVENDCPPGVWGCKKDEIEDDCPPGVWGCKRNKVPMKEEEKKDDSTADDECPPGVWGCKRENWWRLWTINEMNSLNFTCFWNNVKEENVITISTVRTGQLYKFCLPIYQCRLLKFWVNNVYKKYFLVIKNWSMEFTKWSYKASGLSTK